MFCGAFSSTPRVLPDLRQVVSDLRICIRGERADMVLGEQPVGTLQGSGQRLTFLEGYLHLLRRLRLPTKLTENSHEVRAGRPEVVVFPEGLPKVFLGLL